jgi:hypothetical protein
VSLESAKIEVPDAPYGGWQYTFDLQVEAAQLPADPELSIGDYDRDEFRVSWTPRDGWQIDM